MKFRYALLVLLLSSGIPSLLPQPGNTVTYHATIDTVKYVYGPGEPVARDSLRIAFTELVAWIQNDLWIVGTRRV